MIFQEGGRWRSELTALEKQMDVDDIVGKLTPEELEALEHMLGDFELSGTSKIADECADLEWEEVPLPIEEWLESHHHVGDTGSTIFPVLKRDLIELFSGGYHEIILCLHPDTRIPLLDGSTPTIKELSDRWEEDQEPSWVYSYKDGEIGPAKAVHPRKTGVDDYYRVTLDDGSTFTGNSRHQMLKRDGQKIMIKDMVPGDSLMPFDDKLFTKAEKEKKVAIGADNHFVVSVEKIGNGPVYCMTVPEAGNFAVATDIKGGANPSRRSGVISSNTGSIGWG